MKIHEYQAKAILARHGVPVPRGEVTSDAAEAGEIVLSEEMHKRVAEWLGGRDLVAIPQTLELKGFDAPQPVWRLRPG